MQPSPLQPLLSFDSMQDCQVHHRQPQDRFACGCCWKTCPSPVAHVCTPPAGLVLHAKQYMALQVRTAFNMLGPLLNPADATYGLVGVYDTDISMLMAESLMVCVLVLPWQRACRGKGWVGC